MVCILLFVTTLSWVLTGIARHYALTHNVLDVPNDRSAHTVATPRGGGVAFVFSVLITVPCLMVFGFLTSRGSFALVSAGAFIATLGFLDDHGHVAISQRLMGHIVAAILALYWMHGFPSLVFYSWVLPAGLLANGFGFLYLIWSINFYNFMDGIDGIAGAEALSVCLGAALLYWFYGDPGLMILPLVLAASVLGFLFWNWHPARIFMGDAGSGFLGFILGVLSIQAAHMHPQFFWSWLILLGVFIVDATLTLLSRLCLLQKIYTPHATHAYQHAARFFGSHQYVTIAVIMINLMWLWPFAFLVGFGRLNGLLGLCIAYLQLVILAVFFHAGRTTA